MKPMFRCSIFFLCLFSICTSASLIDVSAEISAPELPLTADAGMEYINRMLFFGESTTTHLRVRGGISPEQVLSNQSGTMKLDSTLLSRPLTDPLTGGTSTLREMISRKKPEYLVLSFGLNGITAFSQNKDLYLGNYRKLTNRILTESPNTHIIVQSVYPVARAEIQTDWKFSLPPSEINQCISLLNEWLREFCSEDPRIRFANTASVLSDETGYLRPDFTTDGIHLTASAYQEILSYLKTHAWIE